MNTNQADMTEDALIEENIANTLNSNELKRTDLTNKRIDFNSKTLKRIETMMPVYSDELPDNASKNEIMAYIIARGIDVLFEGEFKQKIDEL